MTLWVVPEGLAGAAAAVVAPAADPLSLGTALGLSASGTQQELARSGVSVGAAGASYAVGDVAAALTYAGGLG
ncbi:hypothetical protein B1987_22500 [Mycobacterium kansasii]|uniref:PE family immunomodulator PE5 n=1 Tax=Mycobacterium attenuatum TaxID=2341086 RepID=A0A498PWY2_9MYCO|nr:hypothetical protein [Mycobacterium attenuatum]ORB86082.1 hypothetical protein B1987_22500 [Mycobacterium kansasii]VBA36595.1 PE family immunomodulator PE5 [Mycobacterium attenuatum]VBA49153.1 PE family immunomodulator PE5 [Mycobacterium attenuatum]VBA54684.1 PE family immunomodulator PE5 [Mycobacterium attenuatum]